MGKSKYINLCGFEIFSKTKEECLNDIFKMDKVHIVSGNPEVLYTALNNDTLSENIKSDNSIIIPDGIGVKVAATLNKLKIDEKIAGIELMNDIVHRCEKENKSVYLFGATEEVVSLCSKKLKDKFTNLNIAGYHSGYFDDKEFLNIIKDIKRCKPYAIFVALGCPKQEQFIIDNMDNLPAKIFMGVGGSFDVISGTKKRAPKIMISLGLEWLYRVYKEPFRIKRLWVIPKFILKTLKKQEN